MRHPSRLSRALVHLRHGGVAGEEREEGGSAAWPDDARRPRAQATITGRLLCSRPPSYQDGAVGGSHDGP
jgi:hypothetical protein